MDILNIFSKKIPFEAAVICRDKRGILPNGWGIVAGIKVIGYVMAWFIDEKGENIRPLERDWQDYLEPLWFGFEPIPWSIQEIINRALFGCGAFYGLSLTGLNDDALSEYGVKIDNFPEDTEIHYVILRIFSPAV